MTSSRPCTRSQRPPIVCVLHGMSGVHSTRRKHLNTSTVLPVTAHGVHGEEVYWIVADTEDQFLIGLSGLAQRLDLPADRPPTEILGAIHRRLETTAEWLWVIDNAYNPAEIARKYLPKPVSGRILITTTRPESELRGLGAIVVELTPFLDPAGGASFLAGLLREDGTMTDLSAADQNAATAISANVSGLPLALDQAAAYIEHTNGSPRVSRRVQSARPGAPRHTHAAQGRRSRPPCGHSHV